MRIFIRSLVFVVGIILAGQASPLAEGAWAADTYTIDTAHSTMGFSARHMMVSTVIGAFDDYQGAITYDPADPAAFKADVTIQAKSINTRVAKRDDHLRGAEFFDVEKHPVITFTTVKLDKQDGRAVLTGSLTMKGVAKEVSIPVMISGPVQGMGSSIIGLSGSFTLNRQDYGINWNQALDNGGLAVSDEVKVDINIEAHK
ncbi:MAG TPA: YceI family protein [Candidatus Omnitrophota bacterium]|nr:YceI family protein [Candidatus Omnitrophota bacterium]